MKEEENFEINKSNIIGLNGQIENSKNRISKMDDFLLKLKSNEVSSIYKYCVKNQLNTEQEFKDVFCYSFYAYLLENKNIHDYNVFIEIFNNLKIFYQLISPNEERPIFTFQTIEKSIIHFTQLICDFESKFNTSATLDKLEDVLVFLINMSRYLLNHSQIEEAKKCLEKLDYFKSGLRANLKYNKHNKEEIAFFLNQFSSASNSSNFIDSNNLESTIPFEGNLSSISLSEEIISEYANEKPKIKIEKIVKNDKFEKFEKNEKNSFELLNHQQGKKKDDKFNLLNDSLNINNSHLEFNNIKLENKIKKFSRNHYTRQIFIEKFITLNNLKESRIHDMLNEVSSNYYSLQKQNCSLKKTNIEFEILNNGFEKLFPDFSVEIVGSLSLNLYTNIETRMQIDFLILPTDNTSGKKYNINTIINILKEYNDERAISTHKFELSETSENTIEEFYLSSLLHSNRTKEIFNLNIFIFRHDIKICNDILLYLFKYENLKTLHIFMQEILISKIKICEYRADVTFLIISFLESYFNIFDTNIKIDLECSVPGNFENREFEMSSETRFYFEEIKENLEPIEKINVGLLILEFFRYLLNFFTYLKMKFNKSDKAKDYDFLINLFEKDKSHLNDEKYFFNVGFMFLFLKQQQEYFNKLVLGFLSRLEDIFFKMCENSDKIKNYEQIIHNIMEN